MYHRYIEITPTLPNTVRPENATTAPSLRRRAPPQAIKGLLTKQFVPLLLTLLVGLLLWNKAKSLDFTAIFTGITAVQTSQWALALLATCGSFWAIGQYDRVLHAQLGTGISKRAAQRSGMAAIGLSQFLGFGALTGTLIRWRLLPEMTLWQAARLSAAVTLSFLAGWAVVAALAVLILRPGIAWMPPLAIGAIAIATTITALSIWPPAALARLPWPSLRTIATIIGLTAMDTVCAGLAFYALLPPELHLSLGQILSAYLFSLGAGLIGSTPGGVGPFEATLVMLLPSVPLEPLLGTVLAFRLVYYVVPATLAALTVLRGPAQSNLSQAPQLIKHPRLPAHLETHLLAAPRAEAQLLRSRDFSLLATPSGVPLGLAAPIGQSLVMLSDPLTARACPAATRHALSKAARLRYRMPALYKCGARMAASARHAGWKTLPIAKEAWLVPSQFSLTGPQARQLRRLLKKAEKANVTTKEAFALPLSDMDRIAQDWRQAHGRELGFSMGSYSHNHVQNQRVFLAYCGKNLVGFVTFHQNHHEMTLDLIRLSNSAPDGTAQSLITTAIQIAAQDQIPRLSLAAVPWQGPDRTALIGWLRARLLDRAGAAGLRRFKAAFAPHWEPLYIAAPTRIALAVAGLDILRRITAPPNKALRNPMQALRKSSAGKLHITPPRPQRSRWKPTPAETAERAKCASASSSL